MDNKEPTLISIVSPVYRAEEILSSLVSRIETALSPFTSHFEIILVEDGSPDRSWEIIEELAESREYLKGINLSRNFGQHYAITFGLDHTKGEWIVVMDCDLQDQPEEIPRHYNKAMEEFDTDLARN